MILDTLDATILYIQPIPITHDTLDIFQTKNPKNFYHLIFFNLNRYSRWKALPTPVLPFHFAKTGGECLVFFPLFFAYSRPVYRHFFHISCLLLVQVVSCAYMLLFLLFLYIYVYTWFGG